MRYPHSCCSPKGSSKFRPSVRVSTSPCFSSLRQQRLAWTWEIPSASAICFWVIAIASAGGVPAASMCWLDQQTGNARCDIERADAKDLLLQDALVLSANPAQRNGQLARLAKRLHQLGTRDLRQRAVGNHLDPGIALVEQRAIETDAVSRQQKVDYLSGPVRPLAKAHGPARQQNPGAEDYGLYPPRAAQVANLVHQIGSEAFFRSSGPSPAPHRRFRATVVRHERQFQKQRPEA